MTTRCHFRHTLTDQAGNAIQNAAIYLYQPTTTTPVLGTMFNAKTGGGSITNPLISDLDGQCEAWFDTAQSIDVFITSNGGTAYLATAPAVPLNWTSYTVSDEVRLAPEDSAQGFSFGSTTGIVAAAAGDGVAVTPSRSDHVHAHGTAYLPDAHHNQAHSFGDHSDVNRSFFQDMEAMNAVGPATQAAIGSGPNWIRVITFPDAATNSARFKFRVPDDYVSGLAYQIYWVADVTDATSAHAVVWDMTGYDINAIGQNVITAGQTAQFTGDNSSAKTADFLIIEAAQPVSGWLAATPAAGDIIRCVVRRIGADASDTFNQQADLVGIKFNYVANQ